jgi:hypothetical protein
MHQGKNLETLDPQRAEDARSLAQKISARHPFTATNGGAPDASADGSEAEGCDPAFMKLLEEGAHLDIERMPL